MDMLLSNCKIGNSRNEHVEYAISIMEGWIDTELVIRYKFISEKATLDIGGFIIKSIEPVENQNEFGNKIAEEMTVAIVKYLAEKFENSTSYLETVRGKIKEELKKESMFYNFDKSKDDIAFPFFDLDISYNVMKRVRKKCKEEIKQFREKREFLDNILRIYDYIDSELKRQRENGGSSKYGDVFTNYPFIVAMKELKENDIFRSSLNILLNAGIKLQSPEDYVED